MRATVSVIGGKGMLVSPAENARRLAICDTCESVERIREYRRCSVCKGWLDGRVFKKAALKTESCPLNKWNEPAA